MKLINILLAILLIGIIISCSKFSSNDLLDNSAINFKKDFFKSTSQDPIIKKVIKKLSEQNEKSNFVDKLSPKFGNPFWDKVMLPKLESTSLRDSVNELDSSFLIIPFTINNDDLSAILMCSFQNDSFHFEFLDQAYLYRITHNYAIDKNISEKLLSLFMYMDNLAFGQKEFCNIPSRYFSNSYEIDSNGNKTIEIADVEPALRSSYTYTICIRYYCPVCHGLQSDCPRGGSWLSCFSFTITNNDGGGTIVVPGDGGGGGGSTSNYPPCQPTNLNWYDKGIFSGTNSPCTQPNSTFNPYNADTLILDTSITNNFPCVRPIIDTINSFLNANAIAQVALHEIFNVNKLIKAQLKVDWTLTKDSKDAETDANTNTYFDMEYSPTIRLNPWVLNNSSNIYVASTIIHEVLHVYIYYMRLQLNNNVITAQTFANLFPIYTPLISNNNGVYTISGSISQHNVIAANLVNLISAPLSYFHFDQSISNSKKDSIINALAWGGLSSTDTWMRKSDTVFIKALNLVNRDTSLNMPIYMNNGIAVDTFLFDSKTLKLKTGCE